MAKRLPAWFKQLDLREALLCWLSSAQERWESAAISAFGDRWSAAAIRYELRELARHRHIMLMGVDRVVWAIHVSGRVLADRARKAAKQKAAA